MRSSCAVNHFQFVALIMVLSLCPVVASGQGKDDAITELMRKERQLYQAGRYADALPLAQSALEMSEKTLRPEDPDLAVALHNLAELYQALGKYAKAEFLYSRALAIRDKALGSEDQDVAATLNNLAELYKILGWYTKAEPLLRRSLGIREKALGRDDPEVATTLNNLADLYQILGEYNKTEPLFLRALAIREKALGPEHHEVGASLSSLAGIYLALGKHMQAEPLLRRALEVQEKALGSEHPDVALVLNRFAHNYIIVGEYSKAEPLLARALEIQEKALGLEHTDVAGTLNLLAELYQANGQHERAELLLGRSLRIWEEAVGAEHPGVAATLSLLAGLERTRGEYARAEPLYQRSQVIWEKVLGPEHPGVAAALNNLAGLYLVLGEQAKAEPLLRRALAIQGKALGPEHPSVAAALNNLAGLYRAIGDYTKAEPLYDRALAIQEKVLGTEHPAVASILNNLAVLYENTRKYEKAKVSLDRALKIQEKALGPEHPYVATTLNDLAAVYHDMGKYKKAEALYARALAIREKMLGPDHLEVATTLNNLAVLYKTTGDNVRAEPLLRRALTIQEKVLSSAHPDVGIALNNLAVLAAAQHRYRSAFDFFKRGILVQEKLMQNVFTFTTEEQKLRFIDSISGDYFAFLSLVHQHLKADPEAVRGGLEIVLRRKGVVFDAHSRIREKLQGRLPEVARKEWERLAASRSELARLLLHRAEPLSPEMYRPKVDLLHRQIEEIERRLVVNSAVVAVELRQRELTVGEVSKNLPPNSALLEFVKFRDYDFAKGTGKPSWRYISFVLTAAGEVALVDLGDARALEANARRALKEIRLTTEARGIQLLKQTHRDDPTQQSIRSLGVLYMQVWEPFGQTLANVEKVVISPDGLLNLVPFAALVDTQGHPLVDRYQIAYVSSGRELVGTERTISKPGSDLLLVANPAFDKNVPQTGGRDDSVRSIDFRNVFSSLPGTERESQEIPPLVAEKVGVKEVLVGERATERAVKSVRSPRILHLATHGFFLSDELPAPAVIKQGDPPERGISVQTRVSTKRYENPLIRSGLAFAGANNAAQVTEGDDGILTAFEITGMDLSGTELVVLSACETGVGEVQSGEGVFGLRRAFALAGAKNLMMSLWPVSDEVTARQMKSFYSKLQRLAPAEALREAQRETIQELQIEYNGIAPPGLWAPFILQGAHALAP